MRMLPTAIGLTTVLSVGCHKASIPVVESPRASPPPAASPAPHQSFAQARRLLAPQSHRPTEAYPLLLQACEQGLPQACTDQAILLRNAHGVQQDLPQALALLAKGCSAGHASACTEAGVHYDQPWGVTWDEDRARALYQRGMDGGDLEAMVRLAELERLAFRHDEALILADRACTESNPRGCMLALSWDYIGRSTSAGAKRAITAAQGLERDCSGSDPRIAGRSCLMLALEGGALFNTDHDDQGAMQSWRARQPTLGSEAREAHFAQAGCDRGLVVACGRLGLVTDETPEGWQRLELACERGGYEACGWMAYTYFHDWVGAHFDRARSIELYAHVCGAGADTEACRMWETYCGDDTFGCPPPPPDPQADLPRSDVCGTGPQCHQAAADERLSGSPRRAAQLYEEACTLEYAQGCFRLGDLRSTGELGQRDLTAAVLAYDRACRLDHAIACMQAGAYEFDLGGREVSGCAHLQRGCELGEDVACRLVEQSCAASGRAP